MNCPRCGAEYTELQSVRLISEGLNRFGRKEIMFQAMHINWVIWQDGKYYCLKCGLSFTFQEGIMQELEI